MQRFAAPEQDPSSLDSLVQSASAASDVFMLGAVTYQMLVGQHAFPAKEDGIGRARRWQVLQSPICLLASVPGRGLVTQGVKLSWFAKATHLWLL